MFRAQRPADLRHLGRFAAIEQVGFQPFEQSLQVGK
jgi:hypothetical protein